MSRSQQNGLQDLERAVLAPDGKRSGDEISFRCPYPAKHKNGDARPSASYNARKGVWKCMVCEQAGGARNLSELLGVPWRSTREIVASYPYVDEDSKVLFEVVRLANPKDFRQRKPTGKDGWTWKTKGVRRVLYRLPDVLTGILQGRRIHLVEGEKDADALAAMGLVASTNAGGAKRWLKGYTETLRGARVAILPDNDPPGRDHAAVVASNLHGIADEIRIVELPDLPESGDVSDWIAASRESGRRSEEIRDELEHLVAQAPPWKPPPEPAQGDDGQLTQAQLLLKLAEPTELFHTPDREGFATFPVGDHRETWPLKSMSFRRWLGSLFYRKTGKAPGSQALQDAIANLQAQAEHDCEQRETYVRVAEARGAIYLDLANERWEVVEITANGYGVVTDPAVRFRRSRAMKPLPAPEPGGSVDELRRFVNVADRPTFALILGWLVSTLRMRGPFPLLVIQGEQGTAKSSLARLLRSLIDPVKAPLRSAPSGERDLAISAANSWCLAYDNLSSLPPWLADALCRLSTGGGLSTRELFSNDDEIIFDVQRPAILTGIEELATRPDLADRGVLVHLETIGQVVTEERLREEFEAARPRILGALCEAVATALRRLPTVDLPIVPRMADFATWATAAEPALGLAEGEFLKAYLQNRGEAVEIALETDPVAGAVRKLAAAHGSWSGTATSLLEELGNLTPKSTRRSRTWPKAPGVLSGRLRRAASFLRAVGVDVRSERSNDRDRQRMLTIRDTNSRSDAARTQVRTQAMTSKGLENLVLDAADAADARFGRSSNDGRVRVEI